MRLLKWQGGKDRLADEILSRIPEFTGRYREPFVGGAAIFLALEAAGRFVGFAGTAAPVLTDYNLDLVDTYRAVRGRSSAVAAYLDDLAKAHAIGGIDAYYDVRRDFNKRDGGSSSHRAAQFIYLNRCTFNGLCRYNKNGEFNSPVGTNGRKVEPTLPAAADVAETSRALQCALVDRLDFRQAIKIAEPGDFIYCDPPYVPLSATSAFTAYTADGFAMQDQVDLRDALLAAKRRGVGVLASNSSASAVFDLYAGPDWTIERVEVGRTGGTAKGRGAVDEVLIS